MSFDFSVGDILLVSQLAYRLYAALSTGRRSAGKEFENALFSLRAAPLTILANKRKVSPPKPPIMAVRTR